MVRRVEVHPVERRVGEAAKPVRGRGHVDMHLTVAARRFCARHGGLVGDASGQRAARRVCAPVGIDVAVREPPGIDEVEHRRAYRLEDRLRDRGP